MKNLSNYLNNEIEKILKELDSELMHKKNISYAKLHMLKELLEIDESLEEYCESDHDENIENKYSEWLKNLKNEDGSHGEHWTISQTTDVAKDYNVYFENISEKDWHMVLNMIYSDYYDVAKRHNVNTIEFYVDMAKAWLWDKDALNGKEKIKAYYENIVKPNKK